MKELPPVGSWRGVVLTTCHKTKVLETTIRSNGI